MVNLRRLGLKRELLIRIGSITWIFILIGFVLLQRNMSTPDKVYVDIPLLFIPFGVAITVSVLYCLRKYQVMNVR